MMEDSYPRLAVRLRDFNLRVQPPGPEHRVIDRISVVCRRNDQNVVVIAEI